MNAETLAAGLAVYLVGMVTTSYAVYRLKLFGGQPTAYDDFTQDEKRLLFSWFWPVTVGFWFCLGGPVWLIGTVLVALHRGAAKLARWGSEAER